MSLIQHVTSHDGIDREEVQPLDYPSNWNGSAGYGTIESQPLQSHHKSIRRVISYDAVANPEESSQTGHSNGGITQYKVSTLRRIAQVAFTIFSCWLASGIVFGFAALKSVLIDQEIYREFCTADELIAGVTVCYEQNLKLNTFFALGSTTANVSALPVGTILDRYGPRVSAILGCICLIIASLLMAFAFHIPEFDGYIVGNIFLALGGTFIFVSAYSIADAFPQFSGIIVALVTGAFDASAAVFLLFRLIYEATDGAFTPVHFFLLYLTVPIFIIVAQALLMNDNFYKSVPQLEMKVEHQKNATRDVHDSDEEYSDKEISRLRQSRRERRASRLQELDKLLGNSEQRHERAQKEQGRLATSGVWGALHGKTALQQMITPWFILITLLTVLQMLRMNFFIATIRAQYTEMLGSKELGKTVNRFFDIALPVGGVAATPFIGLILDNLSTAAMLGILVAMITAIGVAGCLPFMWAAYLNIILFTLCRPLYYSAISDYATKVFGFATFGRVYGCIIALSGLVNLFQPMLDAMDHNVFHDNPIPVNLGLASLGSLIGAALVLYVLAQSRRMEKDREILASEMERHSTIREEDESEYVSFVDLLTA